jgi:hypothetical protein
MSEQRGDSSSMQWVTHGEERMGHSHCGSGDGGTRARRCETVATTERITGGSGRTTHVRQNK